jgi:BirA family biotin operon repressor/biotin-[acetyl-CoA-carboxylase] ligase
MNDALGPDQVKSNLNTSRIGSEVLVFASTASTNDLAWHYATKKANDGTVVFAEFQTAGRGRGANKWLAQKGQGVLCSVLLMDEETPAEMLILASAVAAAEAIGRCGKKNPRIKWPNDILINNKKLAGILVESKQLRGKTNYVIGIGVNCHQQPESFDPALRQIATSIDIETGTVCDRTAIAKRLLVSLDEWILKAQNDRMAVIEKWQQLNTQLHQRITFTYNKKTFSGNVLGIDPQHGLIVQLENGGVRMFEAAQTSMVK